MAAGQRRPAASPLILRNSARFGHFAHLRGHRAWEGRLSPTMRQVHPAGERLFVDFAGQTVEVVDPATGEVRAARAPNFLCR